MANDIKGINAGRTQQANEKQVQNLRRETASGSNSRAQTGGGANAGQDKVSLTDMASRMKSLEQKLAQLPEVDQSRVDRVRDSLSRGEYRVDADRVADKMMDFEADF